MDDDRKSVLVAALSLYAEQLAKNKAEEEGKMGKGKGIARDEDVDLDAVIQGQIALCGELAGTITTAKSVPKALGHDHGSEDEDDDSSGGGVRSDKGKGKGVTRKFSRTRSRKPKPERKEMFLDDEEPYVNPFTGLPVVPETGFEAGPSWRTPPPLRVKPSNVAESPLVTPASSHSDLKRMHSIARKSVGRALREKTRDPSPVRSVPALVPSWAGSTPPLPWGEHRPSQIAEKKGNWFSSISKYGSKTIKAVTGSQQMTEQRQHESPLRGIVSEPEDHPPSYDFDQAESGSSVCDLALPSRATGSLSQEALPLDEISPPAYDSLSALSRRSSAASVFTAGRNSSIRSPSDLIHSNTLSPNTTGGSLVPGVDAAQYAWKRVSQAVFQPTSLAAQNASSRSPPASRDTSYALTPHASARSISSSEIDHRDQPSQVELRSRRPSAPYSRSGSTLTDSQTDVRSSAGTSPSVYRRREDEQQSRPYANSSFTPNPPSFSSVSEHVSEAPNSNNPWKDQMSSDEAFAKSLMEEEMREVQMEREMLLALSLENGAAGASDMWLADYMAREMAEAMGTTSTYQNRSTRSQPTATGTRTTGTDNMSDLTSALSQLEPDMLAAQSLARELNAEHNATDASFAAAMRLQAEYDAEAEHEEAWEEWKKANVEECVVCGEEHGKDMLLRPCEHGYCEGCLKEGFEGALYSKTPLKCCDKNLDIADCTGLSAKFVSQYDEMIIELTAKNPTYCHVRKCGVFMPPRLFVGDVGTCEKCRGQTCKHCRQKVHPGRFCEEDQETKAVKEMGRAKGWKTCPGCNHMIERQDGCLHMVCTRCQTAFCYRCSKRWKDCESTCPDVISATHPKI